MTAFNIPFFHFFITVWAVHIYVSLPNSVSFNVSYPFKLCKNGDNMDLPIRKSNRLKNYDYSTNGAYFVTICTDKRKNILSNIYVGQGLAPAVSLFIKIIA